MIGGRLVNSRDGRVRGNSDTVATRSTAVEYRSVPSYLRGVQARRYYLFQWK